jgi:hypothetical protein
VTIGFKKSKEIDGIENSGHLNHAGRANEISGILSHENEISGQLKERSGR